MSLGGRGLKDSGFRIERVEYVMWNYRGELMSAAFSISMSGKKKFTLFIIFIYSLPPWLPNGVWFSFMPYLCRCSWSLQSLSISLGLAPWWGGISWGGGVSRRGHWETSPGVWVGGQIRKTILHLMQCNFFGPFCTRFFHAAVTHTLRISVWNSFLLKAGC